VSLNTMCAGPTRARMFLEEPWKRMVCAT
jgi:hypothetical protein